MKGGLVSSGDGGINAKVQKRESVATDQQFCSKDVKARAETLQSSFFFPEVWGITPLPLFFLLPLNIHISSYDAKRSSAVHPRRFRQMKVEWEHFHGSFSLLQRDGRNLPGSNQQSVPKALICALKPVCWTEATSSHGREGKDPATRLVRVIIKQQQKKISIGVSLVAVTVLENSEQDARHCFSWPLR